MRGLCGLQRFCRQCGGLCGVHRRGSSLAQRSDQGDWSPSSDTEYFDSMIAEIAASSPSVGNIWAQGEHDTNSVETETAYYDNLLRIILEHNHLTGGAPLAVVMLSIGSDRVQEPGNIDNWETVRAAQELIASEFGNVVCFDPGDLTPEFRANVHCTHDFAGDRPVAVLGDFLLVTDDAGTGQTIYGGSADNRLLVSSDHEVFFGGVSKDVCVSSLGADLFDGGSGLDNFNYLKGGAIVLNLTMIHKTAAVPLATYWSA